MKYTVRSEYADGSYAISQFEAASHADAANTAKADPEVVHAFVVGTFNPVPEAPLSNAFGPVGSIAVKRYLATKEVI